MAEVIRRLEDDVNKNVNTWPPPFKEGSIKYRPNDVLIRKHKE